MWVDDMKTKVLSAIKYDKKIQELQEKNKYTINFTTEAESSTPTSFPTVLMQQLESPETGQTLENTRIECVNFGYQIDIIDNQKTQKRVNEIKSEVTRILKKMMFDLRFPQNMDTADTKRSIIRGTRSYCENDFLL